jgi:hypothetical protein
MPQEERGSEAVERLFRLERVSLPFTFDPSVKIAAKTLIPEVRAIFTTGGGAARIVHCQFPCLDTGVPILTPVVSQQLQDFRLRSVANADPQARVYYSRTEVQFPQRIIQGDTNYVETSVASGGTTACTLTYLADNNPEGISLLVMVTIGYENARIYGGVVVYADGSAPAFSPFVNGQPDGGGITQQVIMNPGDVLEVGFNNTVISTQQLYITYSALPIIGGA